MHWPAVHAGWGLPARLVRQAVPAVDGCNPAPACVVSAGTLLTDRCLSMVRYSAPSVTAIVGAAAPTTTGEATITAPASPPANGGSWTSYGLTVCEKAAPNVCVTQTDCAAANIAACPLTNLNPAVSGRCCSACCCPAAALAVSASAVTSPATVPTELPLPLVTQLVVSVRHLLACLPCRPPTPLWQPPSLLAAPTACRPPPQSSPPPPRECRVASTSCCHCRTSLALCSPHLCPCPGLLLLLRPALFCSSCWQPVMRTHSCPPRAPTPARPRLPAMRCAGAPRSPPSPLAPTPPTSS